MGCKGPSLEPITPVRRLYRTPLAASNRNHVGLTGWSFIKGIYQEATDVQKLETD